MRTTMRDDLTTAIRARDRVAVSALRSALAAIENAEAISTVEPTTGTDDSGHVAKANLGVGAAEAERRLLTEADLRGIVQGEIAERTTAATEYERLGRPEQAIPLREEADVLTRYVV